MTTNIAPVPAVSIALYDSFDLPSQAGQKGRPRSRGRAHLVSTDGTALNIGACQRALASEHGCKPKDVQAYPRETDADAGRWAFIVPGIEKDTGLLYSATMVRQDVAPVSEDAAVAAESAAASAE